MVSTDGSYRAVELLLTEGADKNKKDRWGNTALQDAINHKQGPVTGLLVQWKSELNSENAAGRLCDAASEGNIDSLKLILEHGIDPNTGDYDNRTPLHLAAAEGPAFHQAGSIGQRCRGKSTDAARQHEAGHLAAHGFRHRSR